jgi:dTDP-4-dehydrorhamnose 3,5-epimerase
MKVIETSIPDVKIIEPNVYGDERGFFMESWQEKKFNDLVCERKFVQDNHSKSTKGVLRGLHYQRAPFEQGKLVRCIQGEVYDVAVDIRPSSPSLGSWVGVILSAENKRQLWIPEGFAHGFLTLSDVAEFVYKTSGYYSPEHEECIIWNDANIGIQWPFRDDMEPLLSDKDKLGKKLTDLLKE